MLLREDVKLYALPIAIGPQRSLRAAALPRLQPVVPWSFKSLGGKEQSDCGLSSRATADLFFHGYFSRLFGKCRQATGVNEVILLQLAGQNVR